jgi:membrane protein implicated in regulation of membrane protease activity
MAGVKQARVLRNALCLLLLWALLLWLIRTHLWQHRGALALGGAAGLAYGWCYWWRLQPRIARRDHRYERNKVFVHYLNSLEVAVTAVAYNVFLAIPIGLGLCGIILLDRWSAHWWTVLGASFGVGGAAVLASCVFWYERRHGPLYYQYKSDTWSGAEGLLYQVGTVVQPLMPTGKVLLAGVLWNAVSRSGEPIASGQQVEVISVDRLTLFVDCLPGVAQPLHE